MGDPSQLPAMQDATIQTALEAFAQLPSEDGPPAHWALKRDPAVMGEVIRWAQSAYDVITAMLVDGSMQGINSVGTRYLPFLQALVRRKGG
jgi:hypothetical protein